VLIADDEEITRRQLTVLLEHLGYEAVVACDGQEAWAALQAEDAPPLAILDWMMPQPDGVEICRRLRLGAKRPYRYVIMLTARDTVDDLVEGMQSGADDYLRKPFDLRELRARLRTGERMLTLQDELRAQATLDELTGLLNRRGVLERLAHELAQAERTAQPLSVIMADLDNFKAINDTYGHPVGDEVLKEVSARIKAQFRSYDDVGRYGGEEFVAVLPACTGPDGVNVAERVRRAVASAAVSTSAGDVQVTLSAGVASVGSGGPTDENTLIAAADAALYRAKVAGRNRVEAA
jgi:diguanylate cyclase (GGDEF)-like protein